MSEQPTDPPPLGYLGEVPVPDWLQGDPPPPETVELRPVVARAVYERLAAQAQARGLDVDALAAELLAAAVTREERPQ